MTNTFHSVTFYVTKPTPTKYNYNNIIKSWTTIQYFSFHIPLKILTNFQEQNYYLQNKTYIIYSTYNAI